MTDTRILAKGRISDLSKGFRLPDNTPFSIYLRPKGLMVENDTVIRCRLICDNEAGDFPVPVSDWTPALIVVLPPNAIDTAKYDVFWGASDNLINK